jgi:hypothetical protein
VWCRRPESRALGMTKLVFEGVLDLRTSKWDASRHPNDLTAGVSAVSKARLVVIAVVLEGAHRGDVARPRHLFPPVAGVIRAPNTPATDGEARSACGRPRSSTPTAKSPRATPTACTTSASAEQGFGAVRMS